MTLMLSYTYVLDFPSDTSLYLTKLSVTWSFATASLVIYSKIRQTFLKVYMTWRLVEINTKSFIVLQVWANGSLLNWKLGEMRT